MEEIWKDIKFIDTDGKEYDYTGYYQVSNLGRVRSLDRVDSIGRRKKGSLMKQNSRRDYYSIQLCKNGKQETFSVHRLVATMFIPNPDNLPVVNHINENKHDNRVDNLEWCTQEYNINYGTAIERRSEKLRGVSKSEEHKSKLSEASKKAWEKPDSALRSEECTEKRRKSVTGEKNPRAKAVICIETGQVFGTAKEANKWCGLKGASGVGGCCKGRGKTAGGYHWMYYEDYLTQQENVESFN